MHKERPATLLLRPNEIARSTGRGRTGILRSAVPWRPHPPRRRWLTWPACLRQGRVELLRIGKTMRTSSTAQLGRSRHCSEWSRLHENELLSLHWPEICTRNDDALTDEVTKHSQ